MLVCDTQGLGIDSVGILVFGYLLKRDLDARKKQIARMTREEDLGSLQIELANKKTLRLAQLRQFARIVRNLLLPLTTCLHGACMNDLPLRVLQT